MDQNIVDLISDSEESPVAAEKAERSGVFHDPDLQEAIELSLRCQSSISPPTLRLEGRPAGGARLNPIDLDNKSPSPSPRAGVSQAPATSLLGLDRRKQEEERLARLAKKRKAEGDVSDTSSELHSKIARLKSVSSSVAPPNKDDAATARPAASHPTLQYPDGAVKKTWVHGCAREDDIKFEEVVLKEHLQLAVLSSFQWNMDWLFTKFDVQKTRFLLVMGGKDEDMKQEMTQDFEGIPSVRLCFVPMARQVMCMHSKLMLLFYADSMRIVVPSANLVPYDWGEDAVLENMVFLIDLPRKQQAGANSTPTFFFTELVYFLRAQTIHANIVARLDEFDFSKTANYGFVHTMYRRVAYGARVAAHGVVRAGAGGAAAGAADDGGIAGGLRDVIGGVSDGGVHVQHVPGDAR
ncbi:hypothetical protein LOZ64_000850 [Ophidiomyces ophidiicola]|nr:hypothetical protein LOZ64_000850 [Ophidiomyces ophidiicola]